MVTYCCESSLDFQITFVVADTTAGFLIGRSGERIRELNKTSGLFVDVVPKSYSYDMEERLVKMQGLTLRTVTSFLLFDLNYVSLVFVFFNRPFRPCHGGYQGFDRRHRRGSQ